ncbi:MAG: Na(+)/H(+) antiporter subunit D [Balneolaceae bacterium]
MIVDFITIPGIILVIGALILPLLPKAVRSPAFLVFPVIAFVFVLMRPDGFTISGSIAGLELTLMKVDALSRIFGIIFAATAFTAGVYAFHLKDLGQQCNALVYAGSGLGVVFAGDLFTLIVFWELMAVSSTWLVWAARNEESDKAGMRYLIFHVLGGGLLFFGILWHFTETGSLQVQSLAREYSPANVLMLTGVCVNAAVPPLHAWLADAYPRATVTGAVFMSAFTTKSAVYVLVRVFPGWEVLMWFGAVMAIYGVIYAVICKDIREILAYHIISQVGFMVAGVGVGTEMALNGTTAHAYSHILYKSLLFMGTGAVLYATGTSKMIHLGGLAKKMRWTLILYMVGAFSISGLPLFNGFISKSMTIDAAGAAHHEIPMMMLLLASVGTFLSVGLKLPYYTWFSKDDTDLEIKPLPKNMYVAMGIVAFLCIFYGLFPNTLYVYLPFPVDYEPFTVYHLVEISQICILTFVGFWIFRKKMAAEKIIALDLDWFYRKPAPAFRMVFVQFTDAAFGWVEDAVVALSKYLSLKFKNPMEWLNPFTKHGNQASTYSPAMEVIMSFILFTIIATGIFLMF